MQFRNDGTAIDDQSPFEARSPYSIARIHSVYAGRYYRSKFGLQVYCGYLFNHDSSLRSEQHVNQKVVLAVRRIANGSEEKLSLGDVNVEKEFNYADDIVNAIWMMVNQNNVYELVIGSGEAHSLKEWVQYCFKRIDKNWEDYVTPQPGYEAEYNRLVSDPAKIISLGWKPKVDFYHLADLMLVDHDRCL